MKDEIEKMKKYLHKLKHILITKQGCNLWRKGCLVALDYFGTVTFLCAFYLQKYFEEERLKSCCKIFRNFLP